MRVMLPEEFRQIREKLGFSISDFGPILGVSRRAIQRWESGLHTIPHSAALVLWLSKNAEGIREKLLEYKWDRVNNGLGKTAKRISEKQRKFLDRNSERKAPRKAAIRGSNVTREQLIALYSKQNGKCVYCGGVVVATFNPISCKGFDHIKPIAKGGKHEIDNLAVCCWGCNTRKGAKSEHFLG